MRLPIAGLFLTLVCSTAHADTVFTLQGTLQDGVGQFHGTLEYLSNYKEFGRVTGTLTDGAYTFTVPSSYLGETLNEGSVTHVDVFSVGANYDLSLYIPSTFDVIAGGALCALSTPCGSNTNSSFQDYSFTGMPVLGEQTFQTLTATPQVTPEPSSLLLLGTGLAGVAAGVRRRCVRLRS